MIWIGLHIVTLLGNRNRFATLINLTAKYLAWGSHNAIVGETPPIAAQKPQMVESRTPPKAAKKSAARKSAADSGSRGPRRHHERTRTDPSLKRGVSGAV